MSAPVIEIEGVSKAFGGVVANHNVSMRVAKGGITGLIVLPCCHFPRGVPAHG